MEGRNFYLATTEHLTNNIWFQNEEDFKAGMNFVAVSQLVTQVKIYAFVLMSNHVHFVLGPSKSIVTKFINHFKKQFSQYCQKKYSIVGLLKRNNVHIREIFLNDDSFEKAVAYVHMNPVSANICLNPSMYMWGTGSCFFNSSINKCKIKLEDISARARIKLLHSKINLPQHYSLDDGYILPSSYIDTKFVESVFKTPKRMNYFLNKSSKAKRIYTVDINNHSTTFRDQMVVGCIHDLCNSLFRKENISQLDQLQRLELLRQLQYRFSCSVEQLARVTGIPYNDISKLLDQA